MVMSSAAIDRLGERLRSSTAGEVSPDDRAAFAELLRQRESTLLVVEDHLAGLISSPITSRLKTIGTTIEKLQRETVRLSQMQDLAGARLVVHGGRRRQDEVVARIADAFGVADRDVFDRRERDSHGYRAVHVIVRVGGAPTEIQIRTELQHRWAELLERLADRVGRGVRYGRPPIAVMVPRDAPAADQIDAAEVLMASMRQLAEVIAANETAAAELERFEEQAAESAALAIRERLGDQYTDEYESVIVDAVAEAVDEDRALLQQTHDDIVRILSSVAAAADTL